MDVQGFVDLLDTRGAELFNRADRQQALRLVEDERLEWGERKAEDVIVEHVPEGDADEVLQWLKDNADDIVTGFYRSRPLTRRGFDRQVMALFDLFGAGAFAAPVGALPTFSLFVEGGKVVAEPATSPRHRYGAFLEMPGAGHGDSDAQALSWLQSGQAYDQYLGMNVCRYNC